MINTVSSGDVFNSGIDPFEFAIWESETRKVSQGILEGRWLFPIVTTFFSSGKVLDRITFPGCFFPRSSQASVKISR